MDSQIDPGEADQHHHRQCRPQTATCAVVRCTTQRHSTHAHTMPTAAAPAACRTGREPSTGMISEASFRALTADKVFGGAINRPDARAAGRRPPLTGWRTGPIDDHQADRHHPHRLPHRVAHPCHHQQGAGQPRFPVGRQPVPQPGRSNRARSRQRAHRRSNAAEPMPISAARPSPNSSDSTAPWPASLTGRPAREPTARRRAVVV